MSERIEIHVMTLSALLWRLEAFADPGLSPHDEFVQRFTALMRAGRSYAEIAEITGKRMKCLHTWACKLNLVRYHTRKPHEIDRLRREIARRWHGASKLEAIADDLGISPAYVAQLGHQAGMPDRRRRKRMRRAA